MPAKLYILPNLIAKTGAGCALPENNLHIAAIIEIFIVENLKNARLFLKNCGIFSPYNHLTFFELNKRTTQYELTEMLKPLLDGRDAALITDAGMPGIADPGAQLILAAHQHKIIVEPLSGPSSIFLALSASGLNGQNFCFHGYLPVSKNERIKELKTIESQCLKSGQTQIFMETPYRNHALLEDVFKNCRPDTLLCIAAGIMEKDAFIKTMPVSAWKMEKFDIHKIPAVFLFGR